MGRNATCTIAYGWLVDHSALDQLTEALDTKVNTIPGKPEELWGYFEEVHAIGWPKRILYCTEEIEPSEFVISADDLNNVKLFREWLISNQSDWDEDTEEVFKLIMTTPPKLLAICDYS